MRKVIIFLLLVLCVIPANASDIIDITKMNIKPPENLNMSGMLSNLAKGNIIARQTEAPEYNLKQMLQMNPNFKTYPDAQGIIWHKRAIISRTDEGGMLITRLYVILGRKGLGGKWTNWNIPVPTRGSIDVLEASVYDFYGGVKVSSITPEEHKDAGIVSVNFQGLPDTFIIALSWNEELDEHLDTDALCWFQEDLRVWEAVVEVHAPQELSYRTFPENIRPTFEDLKTEKFYRWRYMNADPYSSAGELARVQRAGVVFSTRQGDSGTIAMQRAAEDTNGLNIPGELSVGLKQDKENGTINLVSWLMKQPEIVLAEGSRRKFPANAPFTREEKIMLAKSWLVSQKVDASVLWQLPFDPDSRTPITSGMFYAPLLEVQDMKNIHFHDMHDAKLLDGAKVFSITRDGRLISRRIPGTKSEENKLSAIMDLRLNENGLLNGTVKVSLGGAWAALLLGNTPTDGTARGAVLTMFPKLTNYKNVKYKLVKGIPEVSFVVENKPGVAGTGMGMLAILPFFEPSAMRRLYLLDAPVEILFPFVIEQNITLGFPKSASEALVSGSTPRTNEKINYSDNYRNRRHRLTADARLEVNMPSVSAGNMPLLRRCLDQWRNFSSRHIPVR